MTTSYHTKNRSQEAVWLEDSNLTKGKLKESKKHRRSKSQNTRFVKGKKHESGNSNNPASTIFHNRPNA